MRGDERLFSIRGGNHPDYEIVLMFANEFKYVNHAVMPKKKKRQGLDISRANQRPDE